MNKVNKIYEVDKRRNINWVDRNHCVIAQRNKQYVLYLHINRRCGFDF